MIPLAIDAHLDDIEGNLFPERARQLAKLRPRSNRSARCRKAGAEPKGHVDELGLFADGAILLGRLTEIYRNSHKFWLRITDIQARESPAAILSNALIAREPVLNLAETGQLSRGSG